MSRYLTSRRMKHCQSWDCHAPTSDLCAVCGQGFCEACWQGHDRKHPRPASHLVEVRTPEGDQGI